MELRSPGEVADAFCAGAALRVKSPALKLFVLGVLAGAFIALGAAAANTAAFGFADVNVRRLVTGLIFPAGLVMTVLLGAELFTGAALFSAPLKRGEITLPALLRHWSIVYAGNFTGSVLVAAGAVWGGNAAVGGGALGVYSVSVAAAKCSLTFGGAFISGVLCNFLVCAAVLLAQSSRDTIGKIFGAYMPVAAFVICGFEHSVANMFFVPAGLFYAAVHGGAPEVLTWGGFLLKDLLPVTLGNVAGGSALGLAMLYHRERKQK